MRINYLRVSVTDRCNFNCIYCRPKEKVPLLPREELLSFEEILRFIKFVLPWGLERVRITGGEPLVRKGVIELIRMIAKIDKIKDVCLTTNGAFLEEFALDLKKAGLKRVNVSLDTLKREKFKIITGSDSFLKVLKGIEVARREGLEPVKVNVVVLKGINEEEILDFVDFAAKNKLVVRFIEYMPFNGEKDKNFYFSNKTVKKVIEEKWGKLYPASFSGGGPASYFKIKNIPCLVGFISPFSEPFCTGCSKLRLSAEGRLRPCLASNYEIDVKEILRGKNQEKEINKVINTALEFKEKRSSLSFANPNRFMFQIGG